MKKVLWGVCSILFSLALYSQTPPATTPESRDEKIVSEKSKMLSSPVKTEIGIVRMVDPKEKKLGLEVKGEDGTLSTHVYAYADGTRILGKDKVRIMKEIRLGTPAKVFFIPNEKSAPVLTRIILNPPSTEHAKAQPDGTGN
jgi:hypothetical protein